MTKKINLNFMFVIAVSIILTVFLTTFISYRFFQQEVFSDLSSFAELMEDMDVMEQMQEKGFVKPEDRLRITWITEDGAVLYDSHTKDARLVNHNNRPEVQQALEEGEACSVRKSQTMEQNIFYYARKMKDGTVIRIAKEAGSIWSVYQSMMPVTGMIAVLSFLISVWIARCLTKAFVRPIEQMAGNMEHLEEVSTYRELMPFITRIHTQHEEVRKNARLRQEFAANVSHELKTPLTAISGYSELIANGMAAGKESRHFAEEIYSSAGRLLTLINDILQLSELDEPAEDRFSFGPVDIYEIAAECTRRLELVADRHRITLSLEGNPLVIDADQGLIEELVYNLCDNAIRYNKPGGHVWVSVTDMLTVRDDGIGIPEKYQKRVFERFFRVDKSRSKKTGGTGLGLAIVKHIVQVHGAEILLDSQEGEGTAICVKFSTFVQ